GGGWGGGRGGWGGGGGVEGARGAVGPAGWWPSSASRAQFSGCAETVSPSAGRKSSGPRARPRPPLDTIHHLGPPAASDPARPSPYVRARSTTFAAGSGRRVRPVMGGDGDAGLVEQRRPVAWHARPFKTRIERSPLLG